jgi:hypothetical protein
MVMNHPSSPKGGDVRGSESMFLNTLELFHIYEVYGLRLNDMSLNIPDVLGPPCVRVDGVSFAIGTDDISNTEICPCNRC